MATAETAVEQRVWNLLIRDFHWEPPEDLGIQIGGRPGSMQGASWFQIFEVAVAATFARLCPDYEWCVTPNLAGDGGVDFTGRQEFLKHEGYGIAAAVTVGGQCKKRQGSPTDVVHQISGSLIDMVTTVDPTFFVVALSSRVDEAHIEEARAKVERACQRHCHILDRPQIEGLLCDHIHVLNRILEESCSAKGGLDLEEAEEVRRYFDAYRVGHLSPNSVRVTAPDHVLAGTPFTVTVDIRSSAVPISRLCWRPSKESGGADAAGMLIGPAQADTPTGADLLPEMSVDDPLQGRCVLELRSHAVGDVSIGEIHIGPAEGKTLPVDGWVDLGNVRVVENVRPRFFELPFRAQLKQLTQEYERALGGGMASVGVVGAGGSGKSRLCEEFALERRRRGCRVVTAKQAKTLDDPHRLLADLFISLLDKNIGHGDPADAVIAEISRYDALLAERAEPAIRLIFAARSERSGDVNEQGVLSALLLLIVAMARRGPIIIHLQDLHWATADVLLLLETLLWQLGHALNSAASRGIFFLFEGRVREQQGLGDDGWDSKPFETFLEKLDCPTVVCASLNPKHSIEFIRRLFEDQRDGGRPTDNRLQLQRELIERIDRTAGGNPFHSLEQVQLLKEQGIVGQNPKTGFLYLIRPDLDGLLLPDSVFKSIQLRWRYMRARMPELALLVWALALLEDRIPTPLFRRLWRELAPDVSLADLEDTDLLWTGEGEEREVSFRHENYFRSLRRFEVSLEDRERSVGIYSRWFEDMEKLDSSDQFRWARVLLERQTPEVARAEQLLQSAAQSAQQRGDLRLARRIVMTSLDSTWKEDDRSPICTDRFLHRCDEELALTRDLLGSDRDQAGRRIAEAGGRIERRLAGWHATGESMGELKRRALSTQVLQSQHLFSDHRPAQAVELAADVVRQVAVLKPEDSVESRDAWNLLEMEALHSHAVGLALSGEDADAVKVSQRAVKIARAYPSALANHVICTYAAILLPINPVEAESVLRECLAGLDDSPASAVIRDEAELNLTEALILRAYAEGSTEVDGSEMLTEARSLSTRVFRECFQLGRYPDAGAAALLLGILCALGGEENEVSWFAQAVAACSRGRHMETLWRAHLNLAIALSRRGEPIDNGVRDHALAAADIMQETLSCYAEPGESKRFALLRSPLSQAARYLLLADDEAGTALLERYPTLRSSFEDLEKRVLKSDREGARIHKWLRINGEDYILY